jgi:hypothetical protein
MAAGGWATKIRIQLTVLPCKETIQMARRRLVHAPANRLSRPERGLIPDPATLRQGSIRCRASEPTFSLKGDESGATSADRC